MELDRNVKCKVCEKSILSPDFMKQEHPYLYIPLYYKGGMGPAKPETGEYAYCGPQCGVDDNTE